MILTPDIGLTVCVFFNVAVHSISKSRAMHNHLAQDCKGRSLFGTKDMTGPTADQSKTLRTASRIFKAENRTELGNESVIHELGT